MKTIKLATALTSLMVLSACNAQEAQSNQQSKTLPNVIFFLADDVGYGDIGVYGGKVPTPNIDQLAAQGMRFTDAHAPAALCAPSRFSLMTGSYPYRNGRPGGSWDVNFSSGFSVNGERTQAGKHLTVGDIMQQAGYQTAFFGKMHFGGDVRDEQGNLIRLKNKLNTMDFAKGVGDSINQHGFDYSYGMQSGIQHEPYAFFENGKFVPINPDNPADNSSTHILTNGFFRVSDNGLSEIVEAPKNNPARADVDYDSSQVGIALTNKALDFMQRHQDANQANNENRPFMLYFASQAIHVPHTAPFDYDGDPSTIDEQIMGKTGAVTSDVLYEVDVQLGKLVNKLKELGIADNTLIIFTSDNGALWPSITHYGDPEHDNNGPYRGYKADIYEGGHRVPFIIKWGDGSDAGSIIKPGSESDQLVINHDWVATMYELTGQNMQEDQAMDSTSLMPILKGTQPNDQPLHPFVIYQAGFSYDGAIREGSWILMVDKDNKATELYDLSTDLAQQHNLIDVSEHAERVARLRDKFLTYNDHNNDTNEPRTTRAYQVN